MGFLQRHQHLQSNQRFNRPRHQRATLLDCICRSWRHCCFVQQNCMVVSAAFVRLWCCRRYKWRANPSSFFKVTLIIITRREREVASNGSHSIEFFLFFSKHPSRNNTAFWCGWLTLPRLRLHARYCVIKKKQYNRQKGDVISDQVRIHNNVGGYAATATVGSPTTTTTEAGQRKPGPGQGGGHTVALSAFGPNINTVKVREFKQQERQ